jgi:uncharacterized protein YdcH (DUF465 family)
MYRNNFGTRTQTNTQTAQNQTNLFAGNYNTLGNQTQNNIQNNVQNNTQNLQTQNDDEIIFAIVTCNITNLRRLVNSSNVNNIIDKKNKYTALHHAVRIKKNDQIIEYLMSCGADPSFKQDEGKDAVDLAIEANYRYLIDRLLKEKEKEIDNLYTKYDDINYKLKGLERTNQDLIKTNEYLTKSTTEYVEKIESLKVENSNLKRKFDESEKAFNNLLKKTKKN